MLSTVVSHLSVAKSQPEADDSHAQLPAPFSKGGQGSHTLPAWPPDPLTPLTPCDSAHILSCRPGSRTCAAVLFACKAGRAPARFLDGKPALGQASVWMGAGRMVAASAQAVHYWLFEGSLAPRPVDAPGLGDSMPCPREARRGQPAAVSMDSLFLAWRDRAIPGSCDPNPNASEPTTEPRGRMASQRRLVPPPGPSRKGMPGGDVPPHPEPAPHFMCCMLTAPVSSAPFSVQAAAPACAPVPGPARPLHAEETAALPRRHLSLPCPSPGFCYCLPRTGSRHDFLCAEELAAHLLPA